MCVSTWKSGVRSLPPTYSQGFKWYRLEVGTTTDIGRLGPHTSSTVSRPHRSQVLGPSTPGYDWGVTGPVRSLLGATVRTVNDTEPVVRDVTTVEPTYVHD